MWERILIILLISVLMITANLILNHWHRRRATIAGQQIDAPGRARLLYFRSEYCGACAAQTHYLEQLDDPYRALIEPIDVEQNPEQARQYHIMSLPTTILIDYEGKVRQVNPGLTNPFKLTRQLTEL